MEHVENIMTYLKWRGDLTLLKNSFNEVDSLILSELSYVNLEGVVPKMGEKGTITIEDAYHLYQKVNVLDPTELTLAQIRNAPDVFKAMADSRRFKKMTLFNYVDKKDYHTAMQFSALHINMGYGLIYIAFRGTDDELVGWKENFNMSFMMPVPSQETAVSYVNRTATGLLTKYILGGHSKGGNLAVYAGVFADTKIQKKILQIHSFDGPGFNRSMVEDPEYKRMTGKISSYVPESSVIGMLMYHQEDYYVVKSGETGILQHDALSWFVNKDRFVLVESRDESSEIADKTINTWLSKMTPKEREKFVEAFFSVLEQAGIKYASDLMHINLKKIGNILRAMSATSQENRDIIRKIMRLLLEESTRNHKKRRK